MRFQSGVRCSRRTYLKIYVYYSSNAPFDCFPGTRGITPYPYRNKLKAILTVRDPNSHHAQLPLAKYNIYNVIHLQQLSTNRANICDLNNTNCVFEIFSIRFQVGSLELVTTNAYCKSNNRTKYNVSRLYSLDIIMSGYWKIIIIVE